MELKDMLGKKKASKNTDEVDAKMNALHAMRNTASDMMQHPLKDKLEKVSVMAKNPQDLKAGLDKAKDLVDKGPDLLDHDVEDTDGEEADEMHEGDVAGHDKSAKGTDPEADEAMHPHPMMAGRAAPEMGEQDHTMQMENHIDSMNDHSKVDAMMKKLQAKKQQLMFGKK